MVAVSLATHYRPSLGLEHEDLQQRDLESQHPTERWSQSILLSTQVVPRSDGARSDNANAQSTFVPVNSFGTFDEVHFWDLPVADTTTAPQGRLLAASIYAPITPLSPPSDPLSSMLPNTLKRSLTPSNSVRDDVCVSLIPPDCRNELSVGPRMPPKTWDLQKRALSTSIHAPKVPTRVSPAFSKKNSTGNSSSREHRKETSQRRPVSSGRRDPSQDLCSRSIANGPVDFSSTPHSLSLSPLRLPNICMPLPISEDPKFVLDGHISPTTLSLSDRAIQRPQPMQPVLQVNAPPHSPYASIPEPGVSRLHIWQVLL